MKLKTRLFSLTFVGGLFLTALALPVCAEIFIGVSTSLTGPGASLGVPVRNATEFWPREIAGEKIRVQVLDDMGEPTAATKNARRFVQEGADLIVGAANTPSTIAIAQVAQEAGILQLSPAPAQMPPGKDFWIFRVVMHAGYYTDGLLEHMQKQGIKTLGFLGLSDAYGESYLQALREKAAGVGIRITAIERFSRGDSSVAGQALGVVARNPDAVLVVAIGGDAALPQKALKARGYRGKIYHTAASVSPDFLRLGGVDAQDARVISGPEQVVEQLPDSHPGKAHALAFIAQYEAKYGAGSRTQFAAHIYDFGLVLEQIIPAALQIAKPGTPAFRRALRDALETHGPIAITKGILHYTPDDHWGLGPQARVMITPVASPSLSPAAAAASAGMDWKLVD